jgi:ParB family chromosome partitioning protein
MGEAIVFEGSERGRTVKVCADPSCAVHFADKQGPSPEQIAKEREKRRKELERSKAEAMFRHRVLAEIIKRVGAPLGRGDLDLVAAALLNRTEPLKRELLARRHKLLEGSSRDITHQQTQQAIAKLLKLSDEAALCKLLVEVVLLDRVDAMGNGHTDVLMSVAKRHRVDTDAIREAVTQEGAAKRAKQNDKEAAKKNKSKSAA